MLRCLRRLPACLLLPGIQLLVPRLVAKTPTETAASRPWWPKLYLVGMEGLHLLKEPRTEVPLVEVV